MSANSPQILLAGRGFAQGTQFVERLCRSGCTCHIAHSFEEVRRALDVQEFDLVLSEVGLPDSSAYPLLQWLEGSRTTLYFFLGVSDGCWWLPALAAGHRIWGEPAMRPAEFARTLESLLGNLEPVTAVGDDAANVIPMPPAGVSPPKPKRLEPAEPQARKSSA